MEKEMRTWFISDTHFGHANIIKYTGRPFIDVYEMNGVLIKNWNSRVKPEDIVYIVGDFCFKTGALTGNGMPLKFEEWLSKLNGTKIFIEGNHDGNNTVKTKIQSMVIKLGGKRINLVHDPMHANFSYELHFTGHVHNNWEIKRLRSGEQFTDCINLSVEVWNYRPVSWEEINSRYTKFLKTLEIGI
jgi:calcineurin-like phosphoesterase family protein